jgi:hypothetical protein
MYNLCLLYYNTLTSFRIVKLQTNNTLFLEDLTFAILKQEKVKKAKFLTKEQEYLT